MSYVCQNFLSKVTKWTEHLEFYKQSEWLLATDVQGSATIGP